MHDTLSNGISFRSFNVIDDFNREALNLTIDTSLPSKRIIRELDKLIAWKRSSQGYSYGQRARNYCTRYGTMGR